jgi:hypothetical protein
VPAAGLGDIGAGLDLLQDPDNLHFREVCLHHGESPRAGNSTSKRLEIAGMLQGE